MMSGSTVLSLTSPWTTFFHEQFSAWEHFVPVANDCADLGEKLQWCLDNDEECRAISERARLRAEEVYALNNVVDRVVSQLRELRSAPAPVDWSAAVSS